MPHFLRRFATTALRPEIVRRAAVTSLIIGTVLAAINHGLEIISFDVGLGRLLRIGLTYAVPYCVSTYAATMQELRHRTSNPASGDAAAREASPAAAQFRS